MRWMMVMLLVLAPALGRAEAAPQMAGTFSPEQRAEIVSVVRAALKADPSILRDAVVALQQDEALRQQAAARVVIGQATPSLARTPGDPTAGAADGDVTVVEFYDLHCPYCRTMLPVVADLLRTEPHVRLVYKDIPILGPGSVLGARAVLAAQRQDGYLKLRQAIMTGPSQITLDTLRASAADASLDWDRLRRDMEDPSIKTRIDANLALAHTLGLDGTPAYVVGAHILSGAVSLGELRNAVAAARQG